MILFKIAISITIENISSIFFVPVHPILLSIFYGERANSISYITVVYTSLCVIKNVENFALKIKDLKDLFFFLILQQQILFSYTL